MVGGWKFGMEFWYKKISGMKKENEWYKENGWIRTKLEEQPFRLPIDCGGISLFFLVQHV